MVEAAAAPPSPLQHQHHQHQVPPPIPQHQYSDIEMGITASFYEQFYRMDWGLPH
ncbi:hypothetical protein A2U01_0108880, partial [Trifolium medium]|nr:hypothetical protein [Trifolium medium]